MRNYKLTYVDGTVNAIEADEHFDIDNWVLSFLKDRNHPIDTLKVGPWFKFENRKMIKLFHFKVNENTNHFICKVEYSCREPKSQKSPLLSCSTTA